MANHLKTLRARAGISAELLAEQVGTTRQQIYRLENGSRRMTAEWAERLAPVLGCKPINLFYPDEFTIHREPAERPSSVIAVPIIGDVAAGAWLETGEVFEEYPSEVASAVRDPRFDPAAYFALRVKGNSINRIAADGHLLICVDIHKARILPQINDIVIARRTRDQGELIELTAKVLKWVDGHRELWPDSDDPRYQDPVILNDGADAEDVTVDIMAIVVGTYMPLNGPVARRS